MKTHEIKTYTFDELPTDAAKEKAREWWKNIDGGNWVSDFCIDNAKEVFALMGFEINRVYFRGFWSQGDGACFESTWCARDVGAALSRVKKYAPQDEVLHQLAKECERIAQLFPNAYLRVVHRGHYYHEHCTDFTFCITDDNGDEIDTDARGHAEENLSGIAKDAMRWIYRQLEKDYEYSQSDEVVDDTLRANEYEFTEDGERFKY